jgi:hypothetical protein
MHWTFALRLAHTPHIEESPAMPVTAAASKAPGSHCLLPIMGTGNGMEEDGK